MTIEGISPAALLLAFAGGLVSCVSPCVLPLVPVYVGHLSGVSFRSTGTRGRWEPFRHAAAFTSGFSVVFVTLGATIGLLGGLAGGYQRLLAQAAGVVLVAMGLYLAGAFRLPGVRRVLAPVANTVDTVYYRERRLPSTYGGAAVAERPGYWRSFAVGAAFAVGWVPCITPVLGAILTLAYAAPQDGAGAFGSAGEAAVLLASYAAGMGLPFLLVGLMVDRAAPLLGQLRRLLPFMNVASGALLVAVGLLVFTNSVTQLNRFFDFLPYVDFR